MRTDAWGVVQRNQTYWPGAIQEDEASRIKWHSPAEERSSQVFCISAFGGLRSLPDGDEIIGQLFTSILPSKCRGGAWELTFECTKPRLLGETGHGTPTNVDVFCISQKAVICVESKFLFDAREGFGGCGQVPRYCAGHYGAGSDRKTGSQASCRLEIADGRRAPRRYWELGRNYFVQAVFREQTKGETCPFAGPSFQLMRNFLFAAAASPPDKAFGVLCIVPEKTGGKVRGQIDSFKASILREEYRSRIGVATYDEIVERLASSLHEKSRVFGRFLRERMTALL